MFTAWTSITQTWSRDAKNDHKKPLTPIIPVLFYHGEAPDIRTTFDQLFAPKLPHQLKPYVPRLAFEIYNLTTLPDSQIKGPPLLEARLWALKYARTHIEHTLQAFERLAHTAGEAFIKHPALKDIELYVISASNLTPEEILDRMRRFQKSCFCKSPPKSHESSCISN